MGPAVAAAVAVGPAGADPVVLQDSNNVVVWLRPHDVVAKVGVRDHSPEGLALEHAVGVALAAVGAPAAAPIGPVREHGGFPVTLWERLDVQALPGWDEVARGLHAVHRALAVADLPALPSVFQNLAFARRVLADDEAVALLPAVPRAALRVRFDELVAALEARTWTAVPLHGEPHDRNLVGTPDGVRFLDFEAASLGPVEWDLGVLPPEVAAAYPGPLDEELLDLVRLVHSARVAAHCWASAHRDDMRWHAEHHLARVLG